jgi:ABC-type branched-subunit amino acid transport system substrate-binding protein
MRGSRVVALIAAAALAGCGSTAGGGTDTSSAPSGENGPGVSAESVKIGFVTLKKATAAGGAFTTADPGDISQQVAALVTHVNATGGIAGRTLEPVVVEYDAATASPAAENQLCTKLTQDEGVFAVVLIGQREQSSRECYRKAETLMIDAGGVALAQSVYEGLAPYLFAPSTSTLDTVAANLVPTLDAEGFFDGDVTVGIVQEKDPQYAEVNQSVLTPALAAIGIDKVELAEIDQTDGGTAGATAGAGVLAFKQAGVDRVIFLGRPDNVGYWASLSAPQQYTPRLALTSFDSPEFAAANPAFHPPAQMAGAQGLGFIPSRDGVGATEPFPSAAEQACLDIFAEEDETFDTRANANRALNYCDAVLFLQAATQGIAKDAVLNASAVSAGAAGLGTSWQAASTFATSFGEAVYAPAGAGRPLEYVGPAFTYTGPVTPFVGSE